MVGSILLVGVATAFNAGVIMHKVRNGRAVDALVDVAVTATMSAIFAGTLGGQAIAMIASLLFSIYLWFVPVVLPEFDMTPVRKWAIGVALVAGLMLIVVFGNVYALPAMSMLA